MAPRLPPVLVTASPPEAGRRLRDLLDDYHATLEDGEDWATVEVVPIDEFRRGTVLYRIIQASRNVAEEFPDAKLYVVTEDGNRWRLPPPAL